MVGNATFRNLDQRLRDIMKKLDVPFGGVSQLFIGDLLQLPPVKQKAIYTLLLGTYESLAGYLWRELLQLYELTDIVRQSGDPELASLLNRVREGSHTDADIATITALQHTDTSLCLNMSNYTSLMQCVRQRMRGVLLHLKLKFSL